MSIKYLVPVMAVLCAAPGFAAETANQAAPKGCPVARVHFDFDSADLSEADKTQLDAAATCLKENERLKVTVAGNTDERGSADYNMALGRKRADAVSAYLQGKGVSSLQMQTESFGKDRPLCDESNEDCWQINRRTTIRDACRL